jgi:hypothetical protein
MRADEGRWQQSMDDLKRATALREELVKEVPDTADYVLALADAYGQRGVHEVIGGRPQAGLAWLEKSEPRVYAVLKKDERNARARDVLLRTLVGKARAYQRLDDSAAAAKVLEQVAALDLKNRPYRLARAIQRLRAGDATAVAEAVAAAGEEKPVSGTTLWDLTRVYALALNTTAGRTAAYRTEALTCLRRAKNLGYFRERATREAVRSDPDLASLRGQPEFEALFTHLP